MQSYEFETTTCEFKHCLASNFDYMLSFDESGDYSDDPLSDVEDVLDDFALSSSSSDGLLFQFISTTKFTNNKNAIKLKQMSKYLIELTGIRPIKIYTFLCKNYCRRGTPLEKYYRWQVANKLVRRWRNSHAVIKSTANCQSIQ